MINAIISDFSRVILFPRDQSYQGSLNALNQQLILQYGEEYDFWNYFRINQKVLETYIGLKDKYPLYIFTSDNIQERLEVKKILKPIFKQIFSAKELKINKKEASSYQSIARQLGLAPKQILYIDDQTQNLKAAKEAGMETIRYIEKFSLPKSLLLAST